MSDTRPPAPMELLRHHGLRPSKRLGQHFLTNRGILARILEAAGVSLADTVLEVGAGLGVLSVALAPRVSRLVAVEFDRGVAVLLRETLQPYPQAEVVEADILSLDVPTLLGYDAAARGRGDYKVVANLPYYITSAVLRLLLEARVRPRMLVVMVQKEVARRIVAGPGEMSLLAVSVQLYGKPSIVGQVSAGSFTPPPKVASAILRIDVYDEPAVPLDSPAGFFALARAGFGQRRKQLRNSLAAGLHIEPGLATVALREAGLDERQRPENLSLEDWSRLYRSLAWQGVRMP